MTQEDFVAQMHATRSEMQLQSHLYQPTPFWSDASARLVGELQDKGVDAFRSLSLPQSFFVPHYGSPTNGFTPDQQAGLRAWLLRECPRAVKAAMALEQFLSGEAAALADYRTLLAADRPEQVPSLHRFSESTAGRPTEQFVFDGRRFSRSALNYLLGLAMLKRHLRPGDIPRTVLEVGGGFGTLGEILMQSGMENLRYVDIDIPPTVNVAEWYLREAVGTSMVTGGAAIREHTQIDITTLTPVSVLPAWHIERLTGQVDLFVNFISFQEMEPPIVRNYLDHVRRLQARWVLLRNMREGKQKRSDGHVAGVETPILGDDYAAMLPGYDLVDRNVYPFGYRTVDAFHSELLLFRRA